MPKLVNVAAAILTRQTAHGQTEFLLGQRGAETFYTGYWEFPGGKIEAGETPKAALIRELKEELNIDVSTAWPWLLREHHYEHAHVRLHFFEVPAWHGVPETIVHNALHWQAAESPPIGPMLPANGPILKGLRLPRSMGITHAWQIGPAAQLEMLEAALKKGLRLVQVRENQLPTATFAAFWQAAQTLCHAHRAQIVLNGDAHQAQQLGADGVHWSARQLMAASERPALSWVGASCHTRAELEHAAQLGLDYAVLGAVHATASHPGQAGIGWEAFNALRYELSIPVFAIGGLTAADAETARAAGAHGIAAIRGAWQP